MKRTNILHEFFNSASDANEFLEATQQERVENDFQEFITNGGGEVHILNAINEMCIESLSPDAFEMWEHVVKQLKQNRKAFRTYAIINLIRRLKNVGAEIHRQFGSDSYKVRCELYDIRESLGNLTKQENQ
ncbi:MAG: hypothetical protein M9949_04955 [Candidatus Kapabacteria bacterium]|nr:hypothetical protein [Candidatus Kapabacteria bacterium]